MIIVRPWLQITPNDIAKKGYLLNQPNILSPPVIIGQRIRPDVGPTTARKLMRAACNDCEKPIIKETNWSVLNKTV
jgi:hypothetical protein